MKAPPNATAAIVVVLGVAGTRPAHTAELARPGPDWAKAQLVNIVLTNFAFTPARIVLYRGMPYRLHFVNNGSGGHNFASQAFFQAGEVAPEDRAKIDDGKVELTRDESADVHFVPIAPGTYKVRCTHFLHATFGMKGEVVAVE